MLIIWGLRVVYHTIAQGVFYCRKCGGDRNYRHQAGRRFFTLFFIPIIPLTSYRIKSMTVSTYIGRKVKSGRDLYKRPEPQALK